jgi:hypothetical protein
MASFVRVIPNSLYETFEEKGLISGAGEGESKENKLLSQLPHALRAPAEKVLSEFGLEWDDKFQVLQNNKAIEGSNVIELLSSYILQSKKLHSLPGSQVFNDKSDYKNNSPSPPPPPDNNSWTSFESSFGHGRLHQKKISKHKNSGSTARSINFFKKQ